MKTITSKYKLVMAFTMFILFVSFSTPFVARADVLSDRINDISAATDQTTFVKGVLELSIPLSVFALIGLSGYAGFLLITSQGDPEKLGQAREVLTNAILGFGLIILSVAVLVIIQNLLNLPNIP